MTSSLRALILPVTLLATSGCAWAMPGPEEGKQIPESVFSVLCDTFSKEPGFDSSASLAVLSETRPIVSTFSLRVLHKSGKLTPAEADQDDHRDEGLRGEFQPRGIKTVGPPGKCKWVLVEQCATSEAAKAVPCLELSNATEDPFAEGPNRTGVFARLRLSDRGSGAWYWVALRGNGPEAVASGASRLEISDD